MLPEHDDDDSRMTFGLVERPVRTIQSSQLDRTSNLVWIEVSRSKPCPICGKIDWCRVKDDLTKVCCRRSSDNTIDSSFKFTRSNTDKSGSEYHIWTQKRRSIPELGSKQNVVSDVHEPTPETLNRVYSTFLAELQPAYGFGRNRGMSEAEIDHLNYRILGSDRTKGTRAVQDSGLGQHLPKIPGFYLQQSEENKTRWSISGKEGTLIPVRNAEGLIVALKDRLISSDHGKYRYISSKSKQWTDAMGRQCQGRSPGTPIHFPKFDGDRSVIRITEGEFKADFTTIRSGILTIGLPGVSSWSRCIDVVQLLKPKRVLLAFDADYRTNKQVSRSLLQLVLGLSKIPDLELVVESWPSESGKGIDDVFHNGHESTIRQIVGDDLSNFLRDIVGDDAFAIDFRPIVMITTNEDQVNREVIRHLARCDEIFQQNGHLVEIVNGKRAIDGASMNAPKESTRIESLREPKLRSLMTKAIRFQRVKRHSNGEQVVDSHPPDWCIRAVMNYGEYPGIDFLDGITDTPILRKDGTVLDTPGYDRKSCIYYQADATFPMVSSQPTSSEIKSAVDTLMDLVQDFPFSSNAHKSAWLASLLTPMARLMMTGPSPLFLLDANTAGSGKTLLVNVNSVIHTGQRIAVASYIDRNDEMEKRITSQALAGKRLILLDNITGPFGGMASIDAALTTTRWNSRILGQSKTIDVPLNITWFATGNNVNVVGDTVRRVLPIRLTALNENPENRGGFRYPNLIDHVTRNRPRYVHALLTILRGFIAAGRPQTEVRNWGSYESWSSIIRQALIWIGLPDPCEACIAIREFVNPEQDVMDRFLRIMEGYAPKGKCIYAAEIIEKAKDNEQLHSTLLELCPSRTGELPNTLSLGNYLRRFKEKVINGRFLWGGQKSSQGIPWEVRLVGEK